MSDDRDILPMFYELVAYNTADFSGHYTLALFSNRHDARRALEVERNALGDAIIEVDPDRIAFYTLEDMTEWGTLRVVPIPLDTFDSYMASRRASGYSDEEAWL